MGPRPEIEGLEPMRDFPVVDRPMTPSEGIALMTGRLGLSTGRIQALSRDRCPGCEVRYVRKHVKAFKPNVKCFLRHDVMYTDILHTGYEELRHLGIGRRYLVNRLLRLVAAGMCDALDGSGEAGDFPPRSWMPPRRAEYVKKVQETVLAVMKVEQRGLLHSLKIRLSRVATDVLKDLASNPAELRKQVKNASMENLGSGLRRFSDMLVEYKDRLYRTVRKFDYENRKRWRKKTSRKRVYRRLDKDFFLAKGFLQRTMTDLRKLKDPGIRSFYRRPTDPDWYEGDRAESRRVWCLWRKHALKERGLKPIPGATGYVTVEEWYNLRTDWKLSEVRIPKTKSGPDLVDPIQPS